VAALKEVRRRIRVVGGIQQVTNAMKMVAAVKMRRVEGQLIAARPYCAVLYEVAGRLASAFPDSAPRGLTRQRPAGGEAIVVMGSDGGLCGSFNSTLFREVLACLKESKARLILIGRKAREFFSRKSIEAAATYEKLESPISVAQARMISEELCTLYDSMQLRSVTLAYQEFVSPGASRIKMEQWLPFLPGSEPAAEVRCEPDPGRVLESVLPRAIAASFRRALLESQASEQGTRMVAMDSATANAGELKEELTLVSNKIRQWNITKELLEITTGVEVLEN
jgi:F-type H+-transporting ATPase subunit gamma